MNLPDDSSRAFTKYLQLVGILTNLQKVNSTSLTLVNSLWAGEGGFDIDTLRVELAGTVNSLWAGEGGLT